MKTNFKKLQLGTREMGLETINVVSVGFEEYPTKKNEKQNAKTTVPIWVEIDEDNLRALLYYYERISEGDLTEGKDQVKYTNIIGAKRNGCSEWEDIEDVKKEFYWHLDYNIPFQFEGATYLVRIN